MVAGEWSKRLGPHLTQAVGVARSVPLMLMCPKLEHQSFKLDSKAGPGRWQKPGELRIRELLTRYIRLTDEENTGTTGEERARVTRLQMPPSLLHEQEGKP